MVVAKLGAAVKWLTHPGQRDQEEKGWKYREITSTWSFQIKYKN
jgi:hypothetical protein